MEKTWLILVACLVFGGCVRASRHNELRRDCLELANRCDTMVDQGMEILRLYEECKSTGRSF